MAGLSSCLWPEGRRACVVPLAPLDQQDSQSLGLLVRRASRLSEPLVRRVAPVHQSSVRRVPKVSRGCVVTLVRKVCQSQDRRAVTANQSQARQAIAASKGCAVTRGRQVSLVQLGRLVSQSPAQRAAQVQPERLAVRASRGQTGQRDQRVRLGIAVLKDLLVRQVQRARAATAARQGQQDHKGKPG